MPRARAVDDPASERVAPLTELDYEELLALRRYQRHASDELPPEAWMRLGELEQRLRAYRAWQEAERTRRVSHLVTLAKVREIERKMQADDAITEEELWIWEAALTLSQPSEPLEHVLIDEGDEWPPDPPSHAAWDAWLARPISESLFPRHAPIVVIPTRIRRGSPGRRTPRARRTVRSSRGSPARQSDDPDLEPACPRCGHPVVVLRGLPTCGACWADAVLSLEEHFA